MEIKFIFNIYTTRFLGTQDVAKISHETLLSKIPTAYQPTKVSVSSTNKGKYSKNDPEAFYNAVPGEFLYSGDVSVWKVKDKFSFHIIWHKADQDYLNETPGKKFNSLGFDFDDGELIISSEKEFKFFENAWLQLCNDLNATYGFAYADHKYKRVYGIEGHGRCLPRLHWRTYFGKEYSDVLNLQTLNNDKSIDVISVKNGSLLSFKKDPRELIDRTEIERNAIERIGKDYFWDINIKNKHPYRMPPLNLSEILIED